MTEEFSIDNIKNFVGKELGVSQWFVVDQGRIDFFGAASYDIDPQHNDPEWAAVNSPYGATIAFGFQTLSMLSYLSRTGGLQPKGVGYALNYGFDRVRFITPVLVGSRIRLRAKLGDARERSRGVYVLDLDCTVEIEHNEQPALTARWLGLVAAEDVDPASI